jgi:hypothetical protein
LGRDDPGARQPAHGQLVRELRAGAGGLVVIDGPPRPAGTAGATFAAFAAQVVLVMAAGQTSEAAIDASLRRRGERDKVRFVPNRGRSPAVARTGRLTRATDS